jgi:putative Mg2+ transporter-C (MgtC) family protein
MSDSFPLTEVVMLERLCLSFIAGAIIGFERSSRRQVAGLRTHILISLGATLLMLLSIRLSQEFMGLKSGDPGRVAAQVVSGIGFLGAGAMIRLGNNVKGLTTAASLWLVAAVGLVIGAGMYIAAAATEVLTLITLMLLGILEKKLFPAERNKVLELYYKQSSTPDTRTALDILKNFGIRSQSMDVNQGIGKGKGTRIRFLVSIPDSTDITKLVKTFKTTASVALVEIKEKY